MATPSEREQVGQLVMNTMLSSSAPPVSGLLALEIADALIDRGWIDL